MGDEQDAPWSVEIPASEVPRLLGPEGETLQRLSRACGCEIEIAKQKKSHGKKVNFQGQTQTVDEEDEGKQKVKVFLRGVAKKRFMAAEVVRGVAEGQDPEDHAARAEGAVILPHDMRHPEREAWARWRLLSAGHEFGAKSHLGRNTIRFTSKAGGPFAEDVAAQLETKAKDTVSEAFKLAELKVDAMDEFEPENSVDDAAVIPFVEQHGVILRVCDQDDNALCDTITIRVVGPAIPAADAAAVLTARYIDAKVTACVLQVMNQVQNMTAEMTKDFAGDLQEMETEMKVEVHRGKTALWVCGDDEEKVVEGRKMLQEMLVYYLPAAFALQKDVPSSVIERLRGDADLGVLMSRPDCAVMLDEPTQSVWICGNHRAAVQQRISELSKLPAIGDEEAEPARKRRRTNALSFCSELVG